MKPIFIGIAGGSGAGKSTLCSTLQDAYPGTIGLIQLDDYFKPDAEVPVLEGMENWDHPDSLYFDRLERDLALLSEGKSAVINTKNERLNPAYKTTEKRIPVEFHPKPVMLVEGYLVLFKEQIRKFFTTSIWLEAPHDARYARRVHFKYSEYEQKVLIPMQEQYAEPTKRYAGYVLDVSGMSKEQVLFEAEQIIRSVSGGRI